MPDITFILKKNADGFHFKLCGSILKKSRGHRKMEALHVRMCRRLRWLKAPLFTVAEESGWNGSDALDQTIIHHVLGRLGQGETGDTRPTPADDKKSSRFCQKINHSITVSLEAAGWCGRSYKKTPEITNRRKGRKVWAENVLLL